MRKRKVWGPRILGASCVWIAAACGSSGDGDTQQVVITPTADLIVNVEFANELTKTVTNSLHVWALRPKAGVDLSCNELIGGKADPYDFSLIRLTDHVSTETADPVTVGGVEIGEAFVYVEGVNIGGETEIAGCATANVGEPSTTVGVTLQTAGAFDCSDPTTENGDPCDDGEFCTVGETCRNGACQGGRARNCDALADDCNAAACSETMGCYTTAVEDDTPCDDGLYCTSNDRCQSGLCVGAERDCSALAGPCREATGCNETLGECTFASINQGLTCDDGLQCTTSACNFGECEAIAPIDCSEIGDQCNIPSCSEDVAGGCTTTPASASTYCEDLEDDNECTTTFGTCDGDPDDTGEGTCVLDAVPEGTHCDDSNECRGVCDGQGGCDDQPVPDETLCTGGWCQDGECVPLP